MASTSSHLGATDLYAHAPRPWTPINASPPPAIETTVLLASASRVRVLAPAVDD
jgi:hypothetical protein